VLDDHLRRKKLNIHEDAPRQPGPHTDAPRRAPRLADQLYAQLVNQIGGGTLMPGQRLPSENRLSSEFGVSRPVIREAIARLQADGLVTTRHGSGTFVVNQPKEQTIRLAPIIGIFALVLCFELRTALECETAILAARRWARGSLEAVEAALEESDRDAGDILADHRFHLAVARASQNILLEEMATVLLRQLTAGIHFAHKASGWLSRHAQTPQRREHQAIAAAIRVRDEGQACAAMRHHLENARMRMLDGSTQA
jgi:GntR family transcriptional repressor for pyruvate dehydrogenase complex